MKQRKVTENKIDPRLWHKAKKGKTRCMYCLKEHDEVDIGQCPAFVGIHSPRAGERFVGVKDDIVEATFDFTEQKFPVLKF